MTSQIKVTISGSYHKHLDRILAAKKQFEDLGVLVLRPHTDEVMQTEGPVVRLKGDAAEPGLVQAAQLEAIDASNLVYVVNPGGYIGASATLEIGWARRGGITVITAEPAFEEVLFAVVQAVGTPEAALRFLEEK